MKLVTAVIQPFMLDRLARALRKDPIFVEYTAAEVKVAGHDVEGAADYLQTKMKVEFVVLDEDVDKLINLVRKCVATNQDGDGLIYVMPLLDVVNIETGRTGKAALLTAAFDEPNV